MFNSHLAAPYECISGMPRHELLLCYCALALCYAMLGEHMVCTECYISVMTECCPEARIPYMTGAHWSGCGGASTKTPSTASS